MAQLIVKDLDFCKTEESELKGGFIALQVGVRALTLAGPPYEGAAVGLAGYSLGVGGQPIAIFNGQIGAGRF